MCALALIVAVGIDRLPGVMQLYGIWTRRIVCFVAMCVSSLSLAGAAQARRRPTLIPGTQLTGMGAFMGPVRTVPVAGIHIG